MSQALSRQLDALHELIDHCIKAKEIADIFGPPPLRELIDLVLHESGRHFAHVMEQLNEAGDDTGQAHSTKPS